METRLNSRGTTRRLPFLLSVCFIVSSIAHSLRTATTLASSGTSKRLPIFISCITTSHLEYGINWANQVRKSVPEARYLIWCLDKPCARRLQKRGYTAEYLSEIDDGWRGVQTWYGVAKFLGALTLLKRGEHVIVTDGDFVLRKNVLNLLTGEHDIEMQGGLRLDADLWKHFYDKSAYDSVLCIGFMSVRPSSRSIDFFEEYLRRKITDARDVWDQKLFNDMLLRNVSYGSYVLPTVRVIERMQLPAGALLASDSRILTGAYAVHPSGMSMPEQPEYKRFIFMETDVWPCNLKKTYSGRKFLVFDDIIFDDVILREDHLDRVLHALNWGLFLAKELNRLLIIPRIGCHIGGQSLFHSELMNPRTVFATHGNNLLPASCSDDAVLLSSLRYEFSIDHPQPETSLRKITRDVIHIRYFIPYPADQPSISGLVGSERLRSLAARCSSDQVFQKHPPLSPQNPFKPELYILLMTQRVGSTWLGLLLSEATNMLWDPDEILNPSRGKAGPSGYWSTFLRSCEDMFSKRHRRQGPCGFKTSLPALTDNVTLFKEIMSFSPRFIVLRRKSVARQALSHMLAKMSGNWGCKLAQMLPRKGDCTGTRNVSTESLKQVFSNTLKAEVSYFEEKYQSMCPFLRTLPASRKMEIDYEDLIGNGRDQTFSDLMHFLRMDRSSLRVLEVPTVQNSHEQFRAFEVILNKTLLQLSNSSLFGGRDRNFFDEFWYPERALPRRCDPEEL